MELTASWPTTSGKQDISGIELTDSSGHKHGYNANNILVDLGEVVKGTGYATLKISKATGDLTPYQGSYTVRVSGTSVTNNGGSNDASSRAKLSLEDEDWDATATVDFTLYITDSGKLSLTAATDAEATDEVAASTGIEKKIYVAVDGAQPTSGYANRDTSVVITLSAAIV